MACQDEASIMRLPLCRLKNSVILFIANKIEEINHFENRDANEEVNLFDLQGLLRFLKEKIDEDSNEYLENTFGEMNLKSKFILKFWSSRFRGATLQDLFDFLDKVDRYDLISDISEKVQGENAINAVMNDNESSRFDLLVVNGLTLEDKLFAEWLVNHLENIFFKRIFWPPRDGDIPRNYENAVEKGVIAIYSAEMNIEELEDYGIGGAVNQYTNRERREAENDRAETVRPSKIFPIWHSMRRMMTGDKPLQPIFDKPGEFWPILKVCGVIHDDFPPNGENQNFPGTNVNSIITTSAHNHSNGQVMIPIENGVAHNQENVTRTRRERILDGLFPRPPTGIWTHIKGIFST